AQKLADLQAENVSKLRCLNPLKICKHAEGSVRSHNDMEAVPELRKAQRLFTAANVVKEEAEGVGEVCTQLMKAGLPLVVREAENSQQFANLQAQHAENLDSLRSISQQLANLQVAHIANVHSLQDFVKERSAQGGEIDWRLFESRQLADLQSQHELNADSLHSFDEQLANLQVEHERRIAQLGRVKGDINRRLAYTQQLANLQLEHSQQLANLQIAHIANVFSLHRFVQRRYTQSQQFANLQAQHAENLDSVPSFTQQLAHLQAEHEQQIAQLYLAESSAPEEQIAQLDRVESIAPGEGINRRLAYTQQLANLQLEHETRISELHQAVANSAGPSAWGNTQGSRSPDLSVAGSFGSDIFPR
ncbi:hypothetical protein SeMB42_g07234, partial [Synchytrium endobioticum]